MNRFPLGRRNGRSVKHGHAGVRLLLVAVSVLGLLAVSVPSAQANREDRWIESKVRAMLLTAEPLSLAKIKVQSVDGLVTLRGSVASPAAKELATKRAMSVAGVWDVQNQLRVIGARGPRRGRRTTRDR